MQYYVTRNEDGTFDFRPSGSDSRDEPLKGVSIKEFVEYAKLRHRKQLCEEELRFGGVIRRLEQKLADGTFPNEENALFSADYD